MTGFSVDTTDLTVQYGETVAVDSVSVQFPADWIVGLLGRNGAGKSTLLSTLASHRRPSSGSVAVGGCDPFENERIMEGVCLIRESGDVMRDETIETNLRYFGAARPTWDAEYADGLVDQFKLKRKSKPCALSRGQQSALGAVIGLASRAPLTMFDEVHLGMDAPSRQRFYDLLIADYAEHPRTIVLSSHLINEVEPLLESVAILSEGRLLMYDDVADLRSKGATFTGPSEQVDALTSDLSVVARRDLGRTQQATVFGGVDDEIVDAARDRDIEVGGVSLQDLFIHLTEESADVVN